MLKNKIYILFFLICLFSVKVIASPSWYESQMLEKQAGFIIGYGEGATKLEAKKQALRDISLQLNVTVTSNTQSDTRVSNGRVMSRERDSSSVYSKVNIGKSKTLKSEKQGERWFTALAYDNSSIVKKIISHFNGHKPKCLTEKQSIIFVKSQLVEEINRSFGCDVDLKLRYFSSGWNIVISDFEESLTSAEFEKFLVPVTSKKLDVYTKKTTLYDEDKIVFEFVSSLDGYVSGFIVSERGDVVTLFSNVKVKKNQTNFFPEKNSEYDLVSELVSKDVATSDLYVFTLHTNKKNFSLYEEIAESTSANRNRYFYGKLIEDISDIPVSALKIYTKPVHTRF